MPTISKEIVGLMMAQDGWYDLTDKSAPDNPRAWCLFRYWNTEFEKECWAVCYYPLQFSNYLRSPAIGLIEVLWKQREAEPGLSMMMEATGRA